MISKKHYYPLFLVYTAALVALDQLTKLLARGSLSAGDIELISGALSLHLLYNTGAAFSILTGRSVIFYIMTPIVAAAIAFFFFRLPRQRRFIPMALALTTLFAGAVGNFIDRVAFARVTDFIYFSLIDFPVFNVADIYVTLSVIALLILILFRYKDEDISLWIKKRA